MVWLVHTGWAHIYDRYHANYHFMQMRPMKGTLRPVLNRSNTTTLKKDPGKSNLHRISRMTEGIPGDRVSLSFCDQRSYILRALVEDQRERKGSPTARCSGPAGDREGVSTFHLFFSELIWGNVLPRRHGRVASLLSTKAERPINAVHYITHHQQDSSISIKYGCV